MMRDTLFLKAVLAILATVVVAFVVFTFPALLRGRIDEYSPVLVGLYVSCVPFLFALYQASRLLRAIDQHEAFSDISVNALKKIKYAALIIFGLYLVSLPLLFRLADGDDAPGVFALGLFGTGVALVIATFAAVLQKLMQSAIDIKHENDLTV
jgi:hypothetical protein